MNKPALPVALSLVLACLCGCSGKDDPPPVNLAPKPAPAEKPEQVVWNREADGLRYSLEALGLTVCVYQLKDTAAFEALAANAAGIDTLLDCKIDAVGAKSGRAFQIQPGSTTPVTADRAEEARYLAVAAGYAHLRPELCAATMPFPVAEETKGWIWKDHFYSAAPVDMVIHLGADRVSISKVTQQQQ